MMSRESVPYVVVGQPRLTLGTAVALPLLGKSKIVSQSWIWAIPGVTLDMVEYALDNGPALKKVEGCGSIEGAICSITLVTERTATGLLLRRRTGRSHGNKTRPAEPCPASTSAP